mmetsp:Transcript_21304/g.31122  ORF Transcript_21304/g.31122 Transcript_21304/m.31122 type:complete len:145 (-) Transcript_21304:799-1233(-)
MILIAMERPEVVGGLVGIGSAPDFTSILSKHISSDPYLSSQIESLGYCDLPSAYDEKGYAIHKELLVESKNHFVLSGDASIAIDVPVRLIHGKKDVDIDHKWSQELLKNVRSQDKNLILIEHGDHRLSAREDIDVILGELDGII